MPRGDESGTESVAKLDQFLIRGIDLGGKDSVLNILKLLLKRIENLGPGDQVAFEAGRKEILSTTYIHRIFHATSHAEREEMILAFLRLAAIATEAIVGKVAIEARLTFEVV